MSINRRDFLKYTGGGAAALVVGSGMPWADKNPAYAAVRNLNFTITDTMKEMVTHNAINDARCYFWVYKSNTPKLPADAPGPTVLVTAGDTINITVANALDEPHSFFIPGIFDSGPINPGVTFTSSFAVTAAHTGTHLYFDNLNAPVGRMMGLHGAFVVMPAAPAVGHKWTPYANPSVQVQQLFDDLGTAAWWPGLAWEDGRADTKTPPFRQYAIVECQYNPVLNRDVGSLPAGQIFPAATFVRRFINDAFSRNNHDLAVASDIPQYFTMGGQSGHFSHNNPVTTMMARVGEPVVVRVINAGMMTHSMHWHCNHMYYLAADGVVQGDPVGNIESGATLRLPGPIWTDTFTANPWGPNNTPSSFSFKYDFLTPFMRPPDVPNERGIGRGGSPDAALPTLVGTLTWPPSQEFDMAQGKSIPVRQSPLCYPAHDHSEPSQTSQGGNYNCGVISGQYIIGDLNITLPAFPNPFLGGNLPPQTFPMDEDFAMMIFRNNGTIVYGMDEARTNGIMESSRDQGLDSQADRPPFPV